MNKLRILLMTFGVLGACGDQEVVDDEVPETQAQMTTTPAAPPATPGVLGAACTANADCAQGTTCLKEFLVFGMNIPIPGGFCTKSCRNDRECGADAGCPLAPAALFVPGISQCLKQCKVPTDCRDGYTCGASPLGSLPGIGPLLGGGGANAAKFCLPPIAATPGGAPPAGTAPAGGATPGTTTAPQGAAAPGAAATK